jgi:transposase
VPAPAAGPGDEVLCRSAALPPCIVGIEACGTAYFWAREIASCGHDVRLMPPSYVKPYVKRNKHDAADAEAVCEAVRRPSMRFVPIRTAEQQAALVAHTVRDLLVRQRTMLVNALRGHLAEFGIVAPRGLHKADELAAVVADENDGRIPASARKALRILVAEFAALDLRITRLETEIVAQAKTDAVARRLATIPGIGPIIASRLSAMVPDPAIFHRVATSPRGSGWYRGRARQAASPASAASPNAATVVCDVCSSAVPWRQCSARKPCKTIPGFVSSQPASR